MERRHDAVARGGVKPGHFWAEPFWTQFAGAAGDVCGGDVRSGSTVCIRRGEEQARGGAGLWAEPGHDFQDVPLFRATRLCAVQAAWNGRSSSPAGSGHRRDSLGADKTAPPKQRHTAKTLSGNRRSGTNGSKALEQSHDRPAGGCYAVPPPVVSLAIETRARRQPAAVRAHLR